MLRKHIISSKKQENVPFYSWECLTICLQDREVDLVIKSEKDMEKILYFFVHSMKTIDGVRGSGQEIIQ